MASRAPGCSTTTETTYQPTCPHAPISPLVPTTAPSEAHVPSAVVRLVEAAPSAEAATALVAAAVRLAVAEVTASADTDNAFCMIQR